MDDSQLERFGNLPANDYDEIVPQALDRPGEDRGLLLGRQIDEAWLCVYLHQQTIHVVEYKNGPAGIFCNFAATHRQSQYFPERYLPSAFVYAHETDFEFAREMLRVFGNNFRDLLKPVPISTADRQLMNNAIVRMTINEWD